MEQIVSDVAHSEINERSSILEPWQDRIFSFRMVGDRWGGIHSKVALKRIKELGMPIVKFNARSQGVMLSDILRAEQKAITR